jgi:hypothetical protein
MILRHLIIQAETLLQKKLLDNKLVDILLVLTD